MGTKCCQIEWDTLPKRRTWRTRPFDVEMNENHWRKRTCRCTAIERRRITPLYSCPLLPQCVIRLYSSTRTTSELPKFYPNYMSANAHRSITPQRHCCVIVRLCIRKPASPIQYWCAVRNQYSSGGDSNAIHSICARGTKSVGVCIHCKSSARWLLFWTFLHCKSMSAKSLEYCVPALHVPQSFQHRT